MSVLSEVAQSKDTPFDLGSLVQQDELADEITAEQCVMIQLEDEPFASPLLRMPPDDFRQLWLEFMFITDLRQPKEQPLRPFIDSQTPTFGEINHQVPSSGVSAQPCGQGSVSGG